MPIDPMPDPTNAQRQRDWYARQKVAERQCVTRHGPQMS